MIHTTYVLCRNMQNYLLLIPKFPPDHRISCYSQFKERVFTDQEMTFYGIKPEEEIRCEAGDN